MSHQESLGDNWRIVYVEKEGVPFKIVLCNSAERQDWHPDRWDREANRVLTEYATKHTSKPIEEWERQIPEHCS